MDQASASIIDTNGVVVNQVDEEAGVYRVSWNFVPGVTKYKVYISPTPMTHNFVANVDNLNYYDFTEPIWTPEDVTYYFWITFIGYSGEQIINEFPASVWFNENKFADINDPFSQQSKDNALILNDDMQYYFEEIRRRHQAILENDGEDFYVYLRKWSGKPCHCTKMGNDIVDNTDAGLVGRRTDIDNSMAKDPDYQGVMRCPDCFGTGIYGGYYPKIKIRMRYGNMPMRYTRFTKTGLEFSHDFDSWTLWHPKLHKYDMLHRILDGDRFLVENVGQSEMRATAFRQEFKTICKPKTDVVYSVTDDLIWVAVNDGIADPNIYFKVWM